ncbi:glutamate-rich WD repeat-containing protein 1-like [Babylonia areolata]|uniref:glutamate-rich WD repeat-containing protein 1-like n=1 Tax=Babylonia areolata TaxID=304850 RepID=UPI003FD36EAA
MAGKEKMDLDNRLEEDDSGSESDQDMEEEGEQTQGVFIPGKTEYDGDELEPDPSAYVFLHQLQAGAPCLSFDTIPDRLGDGREEFPMTCYIVSGTERGQPNYINVMKLHSISKTLKEEEEEDSDEGESEDEDEKPELNLVTMQHNGGVNRLRVSVVDDKIYTGSWSDKGCVYVYDITEQMAIVDDAEAAGKYDSTMKSIVHTVTHHTTEGFAIDWSPAAKGWLATGDCAGAIYISQPTNAGWTTEKSSFAGHTDSVEDVQWSPNEGNVFATCSVDRTLRIWNTQQKPAKANVLTVPEAHSRDINVINWNRIEKHLLASGGDDGIIKIWDLRMFRNKPVSEQASFKLHNKPITSLEWNPLDSSVLAASGEDDQITIWDFSVERDEGAAEEELDIPAQLLFQHCGQTDIKEVHWHAQLPGVLISTAKSDFNIFRTISV